MIRFMPWNVVISYTATRKPPAQKSDLVTANAYEERVRLALNSINRTQTGKALFQSTAGKDPIWIVPYNISGSYCNSNTGPFYSEAPSGRKEYEGVKVSYSPERWSMDVCGWYPGVRADEVLFHELVHASRDLNNATTAKTPLYMMDDYEEFFAMLVTNMYRTELGAKKIHREYELKELVTILEAEAFLASRGEYIRALEFFLTEPLVGLLKNVRTPFHPFRDFELIKGAYSVVSEALANIDFVGQGRERERIRKLGERLEEMRAMSVSSSGKK